MDGAAVMSDASHTLTTTDDAGVTLTLPEEHERRRARRDLVKRTICPDATDDELALFEAICDRTGLDPFRRQIFAVKRWDAKQKREVMQPHVSIDGLRLIAQRSSQYCGQTPAEWCGEDGVWHDVWLADGPPAAARVGVLRQGFSAPVYAVALFREYAQKKKDGNLNSMWSKLQAGMIAKCAEALALRKAFPDDMGGLYTNEELGVELTEPEPWVERWAEAVDRLGEDRATEILKGAPPEVLGRDDAWAKYQAYFTPESATDGRDDDQAPSDGDQVEDAQFEEIPDTPATEAEEPATLPGTDPPSLISEDQLNYLLETGAAAGLTDSEAKQIACHVAGVERRTDIPVDKLTVILTEIAAAGAAKKEAAE